MRPGSSAVLCAALAAAGCGGGGADSLTCEYVRAEDNCWTAAIERVYLCMEAGAVADDDWLVSGEIDATGASCADADSPRRASFDPPLPTDSLVGRWAWNLGSVTLWNGDVECGTVTFDNARPDGSIALVVTIDGASALAIRRSEVPGEDTAFYAYECPDGASYRSPNEALASCWTDFPSFSSAVNSETNGRLTLQPPDAPRTLDCDLPAP